VFCPILEFSEEKQTFMKIKRDNTNFFPFFFKGFSVQIAKLGVLSASDFVGRAEM
jgi:hypothetical protein